MLVHPGTRLPVLVVLSLLAASCQPTHSPDDPVDRDPSTEPLPQTTSTPTATPASTVALAHLTEHAGGVEEIVPIGEGTDALGMTHVRFQQLHGGVAVLGGQAIVHVGSDGTVVSVTDDFVPELTVDAVPNVDEQDAIDAAMAAFDGAPTPRGSRLAVTVEEGTPLLVWLVQLTDDDQFWPVEQEFLVDAHTGEVIRWIDTLHTARDRAIYDADQTFDLPGTLARSEGDAATGDTQVDAAYANLGTSYDYFADELGRDSYDDQGATIVASVHVGEDYENAFWSPANQQFAFGDGDVFGPWSGPLDVGAHEFTHAVTEYTAGLRYENQSGGLNEATSDIFGAVVESYSQGWVVNADTWRLAEDNAPADLEALRFMDDPTKDGRSIDHISDYRDGMSVHRSSGIANRAFYGMATHPSLDLQRAGEIWYRALAFYLTENSTFHDARTATMAAAADLYGGPARQAVGAGWFDVGVGGPQARVWLHASDADDGFAYQTSFTRLEGHWAEQKWLVGDVDGDEQDDLINVYGADGIARAWVHGSTGDAVSYRSSFTRFAGFWEDQRWLVGDVDGDGLDDLVNVYGKDGVARAWVHLSTGAGFEYKSSFTELAGFWSSQQWRLGDIDGDGLADLVNIYGNADGDARVFTHRSTGTGFEAQTSLQTMAGFWEGQRWMMGDVNGDERDDLVNVYDNGAGTARAWVHLATGSGGFELQTSLHSLAGFWEEQRWNLADMNGDGRADLLNVYDREGDARVMIHHSTGNRFDGFTNVQTLAGFSLDQRWLAGDLTGDGAADLVNVYGGPW